MTRLLSIVFLFAAKSVLACSGIPKPFCVTHAERPNDPVIKGTVVAVGTQSIQLKVLDVIYGIETRSVITIWDGTDFNCTGNFSMKASGIAQTGDTILAILPLISTIQNTWDVLGDYRRAYYLFYTPTLKIRNDSVIGLINSNYSSFPPYWAITQMSYVSFRNYWTTHQNDCMSLVGIDENTSNQLFEIFVSENLIKANPIADENYSLQITSVDGKIILQKPLSGKNQIPIETTAPGVYFVSIYLENGTVYRKKYVHY